MSNGFRKERQQLALEVQRKILPKYGFKGDMEGVVEMIQAVDGQFGDDPNVARNTVAINRLILATRTRRAAQQPQQSQQLDSPDVEVAPHAAAPQELSAGAAGEPKFDDTAGVLTRRRVLKLQRELLEGFGQPDFQEKLSELQAKYHAESMTAQQFRKERQELALEVQSNILPKYGFTGDLEGVMKMIRYVSKELGDDAAVARNLADIDRLILGKEKGATLPDAEQDDAECAIPDWEVAPGVLVPDQQQLNEGAAAEPDLEDAEVPLTRERALELQGELIKGFEHQEFQEKLRALQAKHANSGSIFSNIFRKERQELALEVQGKILPKYGFKGDLSGVVEMIRVVERQFGDDPAVAANTAAINRLILAAREGGGVHRPQQPQQLDPVDTEVVPEAAVQERVSEGATEVAKAQPTELDTPGEPKGEPSIDDTAGLLTRRQVLKLQRELLEGFGRQDFQARLSELQAKYHAGSVPPSQFRRERQELALGVQSKVLPKYGFTGDPDGVAKMIRCVGDEFGDDAAVARSLADIDRLIVGAEKETRGNQPHHPQQLEPADAKAPGPAVNPLPKSVAMKHVKENDPGPATNPLPKNVTMKRVKENDGYWVVTGGQKSGGLLVRLAEDINSKAWPEHLATGAVVKAVQRIDNRIHYEKVTGAGPNYGWVSVHFKDKDLMVPFIGEVPIFRT